MRKALSKLLLFVGPMLVLQPGAEAAGVASINALLSESWIIRGDEKLPVSAGQTLAIGDRLLTNASGRVDLALWSNASLLVNPASEIGIVENSAQNPGLYLHGGNFCLYFDPPAAAGAGISLVVGHLLTASLRHQGQVCAARYEDGISLTLRSGSVLIEMASDPSTIVISEAGTEIRVYDDGEFTLLRPDHGEAMTTYDERPIRSAVQNAPIAPPGEEISPERPEAAPTASTGTGSAYSYTVYLFSTRSEEIAAEVNARLHGAGIETRIIASESDTVTRYRVAMPGFGDRQSAQAFAAAIAGNHGIDKTWIGRQKAAAD